MGPPMLGGYVLLPDHNSRHCGAISVVKIFSGIRQGGALEAVREMNGRMARGGRGHPLSAIRKTGRCVSVESDIPDFFQSKTLKSQIN